MSQQRDESPERKSRTKIRRQNPSEKIRKIKRIVDRAQREAEAELEKNGDYAIHEAYDVLRGYMEEIETLLQS